MHTCDYPNCNRRDLLEFFEVNDDEGADLCELHYGMALDGQCNPELLAQAVANAEHHTLFEEELDPAPVMVICDMCGDNPCSVDDDICDDCARSLTKWSKEGG